MKLAALVEFLLKWRDAHPEGTKKALVAAVTAQSDLRLEKALLVGSDCVLRINQMQEAGNDSNAVAALWKLHDYDDLPIVACLLTSKGMRLMLANLSLIEQVSDRSYKLAEGNLTGSVLDSDIRAALDGVANLPAQFEQLWSAHAASDRAANVQRLVAATQAMHAAAAAANPGSKKPKTVR